MFIIGGYPKRQFSSVVAQFKDSQWSHLGELNQGRGYHGAIAIGQEIMIIGGNPKRLISTVQIMIVK